MIIAIPIAIPGTTIKAIIAAVVPIPVIPPYPFVNRALYQMIIVAREYPCYYRYCCCYYYYLFFFLPFLISSPSSVANYIFNGSAYCMSDLSRFCGRLVTITVAVSGF